MKKIYILFFMMLFGCAFSQSARILMHDAKKAYAAGDYKAAAQLYQQAHSLDPKNADAMMGLGNSLQKQGKWDEAISTFQKAEKLPVTQAQKSFLKYNTANALIQKGKTDQAVAEYRKALMMNPGNDLIRKNYQIAVKKQQNKNSGNSKKNPQEKQNSEQQKSPSDPQKEGKENPQASQNPKAGGQNQGDQKGGGQGNAPKKSHQKGNIPEEERKKMLNGIKNREGETASRILNKNSYYEPESKEKDW